ncbi:hypothetical protein CLUP02_07179 [Colletotrichum lupini]|uniref:Uncharacterized protein n=1 Tax=Colletotrichum lupini TaxID=145971 RepID=A0A9Q8SR09_9PEZI|nr:hypothetical protein CLUP02_07179 [Colletotrichum lupini]
MIEIHRLLQVLTSIGERIETLGLCVVVT